MDVFRRNREVGMLLSLHIKRHGAIHFYPLWLAKLSGQYWNFSEPILLYCDLFNSSCKAQREKAEQGVGSLKIATRQRELERKGLCWATPPSCRTFPSQCCWVTACWCFSLRFKAEDAVTYYLLGSITKSCLRVARLAACPPFCRLFTHSWRMVVFLSRGHAVRVHNEGARHALGKGQWLTHPRSVV